jgi:hypothetical protein
MRFHLSDAEKSLRRLILNRVSSHKRSKEAEGEALPFCFFVGLLLGVNWAKVSRKALLTV